MKVKKTITLDNDIVNWVEKMIDEKEFGSLSHAIEKSLFELRKNYENE